jgi:cytochrome c556
MDNMPYKWGVLAVTVVSVSLVAAGLAMAQDESSPLHKVMEQVQKHNLVITKGVRTAVAFKKAQPAVVASAKELAELAKKARGYGEEPSKKQKQPIEKWNELADDLAKEATKFAEVVEKGGTSQAKAQAKAKVAFKAVSKSCTACHTVFRVDEE